MLSKYEILDIERVLEDEELSQKIFLKLAETFKHQEFLVSQFIDWHTSGVNKNFLFPNGYGASVCWNDRCDCGTYQHEKWELMVTNDRGEGVYNTPITENVLPCLSVKQVEKVLDDIMHLRRKRKRRRRK
ncbi:MAG: hypothetical protein IJ809_02940 [Clostridia bacterium]|nr:hypothetical protein [Clostridia bacterium]